MLNQLTLDVFSLKTKAPALHLSLFLYLGASCVYLPMYTFLPVALLLVYLTSFCFEDRHQLFYAIGLILLGGLYMAYHTPSLPSSTITGPALIEITEKRPVTYFGKTSLRYHIVVLRLETPSGKVYTNIPCSLSSKQPLNGSYKYLVSPLCLSPYDRTSIRCKLGKEALCTPVAKSYRLTQWRASKKQALTHHLEKHIKEPKVLKLLSALSVGYLDHKTLRHEFSKTGLQHLLTISGFHFALLALFCTFLLKRLMPRRLCALCLILLLGLYVLYLGPAPSVSRAWIGIFIYLLGELLDIPSNGLNSLGIAACSAFVIHPTDLSQIGFQLSYAATLGILAFYSRYDKWLCTLIPPRNLPCLLSMPTLEQGLYCLLVGIRKGLAIDFAVNTLTLPILLFHIGSIPLMSVLYNLIFPPLFTLSLLLLLLGVLTAWMPLVCGWIHFINELFSSWLLSMIATIPSRLHLTLYLPSCPPSLTFLMLWALFLTLLYGSSREGASYGIFKLPTGARRKA